MAVIIPSMTPLPGPGAVSGFAIAWGSAINPMHNGDVGAPIDMLGFTDRSIQIEGIFGAGGNAEIQGSNDGVNFRVLQDPLGNNLDITAAGIKHIMEITYLLRPSITAGDGTTALIVTMFACGSASRLSTKGGI